MQAGLSARLALSDIFTARRVTLRVLVAVVETCVAELRRLSWRTANDGGLIYSERSKHRNIAVCASRAFRHCAI